MATTLEIPHSLSKQGKPLLPSSQAAMPGVMSIPRSVTSHPAMLPPTAYSSLGLAPLPSTSCPIPHLFLSVPSQLNISIELATLKDYRRVARTLALSFENDPFTNYILNTGHITRENTPRHLYAKKKMDLFDAYFEYGVYEALSLNGLVYVIKDNVAEAMLEESGMKTSRFPYLGASLWNQLYGVLIDSSSSSDSEYEEDDDCFAEMSLHFRANMHPSFLKFHYKTFKGHCRSKIVKDKLPFLTKVRNEVLLRLIKLDYLQKGPIDIWYLSEVATLPSMRGKGLGKILINHVIQNHIVGAANLTGSRPHVYLESSNPANRGFYQKLGFKVESSFSIKHNTYVDSEKVIQNDPSNSQVNMDAMVYYPSP